MTIKTAEFKEAINAILVASGLDKNAGALELFAQDTTLFLNVTNKEYFVSVKFGLAQPADFRTVVDARLFLDLAAGITASEFTINIVNNVVVIKAGKSVYKLPMIYENDQLVQIPGIVIKNKTLEMPISLDILKSILNVNSKELLKVKNIDVNELQKLYYIDESGCFTFTTGACLNSFTLEKPVKLLLNDRVVKLFKLFKEDVQFSLGYDTLPNGITQTKAVFATPNIYVGTILTCDDILIQKIQGPCNMTKQFIAEPYSNKVVVSVSEMSAAISRLMLFTKNYADKVDTLRIPVKVNFMPGEMILSDKLGNTEVVTITNDSLIDESYSMWVYLGDFKLVLDSCKNEHITINCGNHRSIVVSRGQISNLISEVKA